jgi:hypothetical protein
MPGPVTTTIGATPVGRPEIVTARRPVANAYITVTIVAVDDTVTVTVSARIAGAYVSLSTMTGADVTTYVPGVRLVSTAPAVRL